MVCSYEWVGCIQVQPQATAAAVALPCASGAVLPDVPATIRSTPFHYVSNTPLYAELRPNATAPIVRVL